MKGALPGGQGIPSWCYAVFLYPLRPAGRRISTVRPAPGAPDRLPRAGSRFTAALPDGRSRDAPWFSGQRIPPTWALPLWGPENMRGGNEQFEGNLDHPGNCRVPKLGASCLGWDCPVGHGPCRAEIPKMCAETMSSSKEISQGSSERPESVAPGTRRYPPPQPRALSEDKISLGFLSKLRTVRRCWSLVSKSSPSFSKDHLRVTRAYCLVRFRVVGFDSLSAGCPG